MNEKYTKLVEKKQWKKLAKIAGGKKIDQIIEVAEACGAGKDEEPYNLLVDLLSHKDNSVKLAAIDALGNCRFSIGSQITRLLWLSDNCDGNEEIKQAVSSSVSKLREVQKK